MDFYRWINPSTLIPIKTKNFFITPRNTHHLPFCSILALHPEATTILISSTIVSFPYFKFHRKGIIHYVLFSVWIPTSGIMFLRSIHFVLTYVCEKCSIVQVYHSVFIHLPADEHLLLLFFFSFSFFFFFFAIITKTATSKCVTVFLWTYVYISFGLIAKSRMLLIAFV